MVPTIKCKRCGQNKPANKTNRHLCDDCVKAENNRISHYRQHNYNWMDIAKEAELELWERQPAETDREWQIWLAYRDAYPGVKPSYRMVAEQLGTTINVVKKAGQRWSFPARLQAWAKHVDELTMKQRRSEIINMNKKHIQMAEDLNSKLQTAIANIDPYSLKPQEIQGLFRLSAEIERKARIDNPEEYKPKLADDNPELKKSPTETKDIKEVLSILDQAGVFGNNKNLGVRQTTTTEVVVKED